MKIMPRSGRWRLMAERIEAIGRSHRHGLAVLVMGLAVTCSAKSPPPIDELVGKACERGEKESANDHAFKTNYCFTYHRLLEVRDGDGKIEKREETNLQHDPHSPTNHLAQGRPDSREKEGKTRHRKHDFMSAKEVLERYDLKVTGEELIDGRPAWTVAFQAADRKLPDSSVKDKFLNRTAGRVWIDQEDYVVSKVDLRLTNEVTIVGGLVGTVRKSETKLERSRTAEGIWYTRTLQWIFEGRKVLFNSKVNYQEERKDPRWAAPPGK